MKKITSILIFILIFPQLFAQQSTTGKHRPKNVSKGVTLKSTKSQVVINNVPPYLWQHGCGPTALGMLVGFYDRTGFSDLIDGDAASQSDNVNNAIANSAHYDDYSLPIDYYPDLYQDKSELGGAHTSDCIGDFMETSWSSESNRYGWSWSSKVSVAFESYVSMKNSSYFLNSSYEYFSPNSWDIFVNEINSNRPVILLVDTDGDGSTDHFVTAIGYDVSTYMYAIYDTWDSDVHWFQWRGLSDGNTWGIYGFNILRINTVNTGFDISVIVNPSVGGVVTGVGYFENGQTANLTATAETGYNFVNWTENGTQVSTDVNYSFIVNNDRELVANFTLASGILELENNNITLYPNPTNGLLNIELSAISINNNKKIAVNLIDYFGKIQELEMINKNTNIIQVNVGDKNTGIYFLQIVIDNKLIKTIKIIITD